MLNLSFFKKFFEYKEEEIIYEKCTFCNKEIKELDLFALKRYKEPDETGGFLKEEKLFCSEDCLLKFSEKNEVKEYTPYKLNRCSTYYECWEIGNLRKMCEQSERIEVEENIFPYISSIIGRNFCEPANAGIVKSSVILYKLIKRAEKANNFKFWLTTIMTALVIILTVLNLFKP